MPLYEYYCVKCDKRKEVIHLMSECDKPGKKLIKDTTCHKKRMQRIIFEPVLQGSVGGTFPKESELRQKKQKQRRERSDHHFINDVLPTLQPSERKRLGAKHRGKKLRDHEKM